MLRYVRLRMGRPTDPALQRGGRPFQTSSRNGAKLARPWRQHLVWIDDVRRSARKAGTECYAVLDSRVFRGRSGKFCFSAPKGAALSPKLA